MDPGSFSLGGFGIDCITLVEQVPPVDVDCFETEVDGARIEKVFHIVITFGLHTPAKGERRDQTVALNHVEALEVGWE